MPKRKHIAIDEAPPEGQGETQTADLEHLQLAPPPEPIGASPLSFTQLVTRWLGADHSHLQACLDYCNQQDIRSLTDLTEVYETPEIWKRLIAHNPPFTDGVVARLVTMLKALSRSNIQAEKPATDSSGPPPSDTNDRILRRLRKLLAFENIRASEDDEDECSSWPQHAQRGVAEALKVLREPLKTFRADMTRSRRAENIEAELTKLGWYRSALPAHPRLRARVDFILPLRDTNPLFDGMDQVHRASQHASDAFDNESAACVCLLGGGGVGKTAAAFDMLSKQWGLYLCGQSGGELDPEYGAPARCLRELGKKATHEQVSEALSRDLASRLMVLYILRRLQLVQTPLDWLFAQIDGAALMIHATSYIMDRPGINAKMLESWLFEELRCLKLWKTKPLLVLDEAQVWSSYGDYPYPDTWKVAKNGTLLQVLSASLMRTYRQVLVGTQMRLADVTAVASALAKEHFPELASGAARLYVVPVMKSLTEEDVLSALGKVLSLKTETVEVRQALAEVTHYLIGRPRFVGNFLRGFLWWVGAGKAKSNDLCLELVSYFPEALKRLKRDITTRLEQLVPLGESLGHKGEKSALDQLQRLVERSCMIRLAKDGQVGLPLKEYAGLLELCGFCEAEAKPCPAAIAYSEWMKKGRLAHLVAAPLEPLMVEVAMDYLTPAGFVTRMCPDIDGI